MSSPSVGVKRAAPENEADLRFAEEEHEEERNGGDGEKQEEDGGKEIVPHSKRQKSEHLAVIPAAPPGEDESKKQIQVAVTREGVKRTSRLFAPIMLLTGHAAPVYTMKFNPEGTVIASGSHDKDIFLWRVEEDCQNFVVLKGHKNAVLDVQWTCEGSTLFSVSPDKTVRAWDVETGKQFKKFKDHSSFVNACSSARHSPSLVASASDDGTCKLWDLRYKACVQTFPDKFQITAVCFSESADKVFTGGVDNLVKVWDVRKGEVAQKLPGHSDTITGMKLSHDGSYLLTNAMDCTLRIWDMRPFAPENRCVKVFTGHSHSVEKNLLKCDWSPDGQRVTAGSADHMVYIWDTTSRRILYKLPGHNGSVNETVFHPKDPIIGSCSSDKQLYLGEFDPTAR